MSGRKIVMLLENNGYPRDVRPRREAESLTDAGYDVTVIAPLDRGQPRSDTINGVHVRRFWLPSARDGTTGLLTEYVVANVQLIVRGITALIRGADVIHLHNPPDTLFPVAWVARLLRRRVVFDLHDISPELFSQKFGPGRTVRLLRLLERLSVRSAHGLIATNESMAALVAGRTGVSPHRFAMVRNVPPSSQIPPEGSVRREVLTDPQLVYVGSMESQDGVDELPALIRILHDELDLPGATLTVIGDGSRRAAVEAASSDLNVDGHIEFLGYVPHEEVADLLCKADIGVEPAPGGPLNDYCSMVKVGEYMAVAIPTACFALPEIRRMADDAALYAAGDTVRDLADTVKKLADDPDLRLDLGRRGRARALRTTWEGSAAALVALYDSL